MNRPLSHAVAHLSRDTTADAERAQLAIWRRMTPADKLALVNRASLDADRLAMAGIRQRHPLATDRECFLRLAEFRLGPNLVRTVFNDALDILGPVR